MSVAASPNIEKARQSSIWKRDDLDWYVEPERATEALLTVERFVGPVWDPCCGQGNIVKTLIAAGYEALGTDIVDRTGEAEWFAGRRDFLSDDSWRWGSSIVMNPPFFRAIGAENFIRRALSLASGKVCAFVDMRFLAGAERANGLFADHPPARIWMITPRVSCPTGDYLLNGGPAQGGTSDYCWLVWDMTAPRAATTIGWLRREKVAA